MLAMLAILLVAGGAMAQGARGNVIKGTSARGGKAAVVAVKRGDRVEFAADKERMMGYIQKAVTQTNRGDVVKDIYIQTLEKSSYLAVRIEKQGTVFLGLTPSDGGIKGKFVIGPDIVRCVGDCGCHLAWQQIGTNPQAQLVCACGANENAPNEPQGGGPCHMEAVNKYAQLATKIDVVLAVEGFELTDRPVKTVEATPEIKVTQRTQ